MRCSGAAIALFCVSAVLAQSGKVSKRKPSNLNTPVCSSGAVCFSGRVAGSAEFRHAISKDLVFVLQPSWTIAVEPGKPTGDCVEFASVANAPYHGHRDIDIDASYDWTAEDEVTTSPRQFLFVTNCADLQIESDRVSKVIYSYSYTKQEVDKAMNEMGSSPMGTGRLWITNAKVSHGADTAEDKRGVILWMEFTVEIRLPRKKSR